MHKFTHLQRRYPGLPTMHFFNNTFLCVEVVYCKRSVWWRTIPERIQLNKIFRGTSVYKYWLLMRGMVENYCPEVKLNPGLLFTEARIVGQCWVLPRVQKFPTIPRIKEHSIFVLYTPLVDFLVRTEPYNLESRLLSSKFGCCDSFFESQGNSKK